jgi:hypothetical protein
MFLSAHEQPVSLIFILHTVYSESNEQATTKSFKKCYYPWRPTAEEENKGEFKRPFQNKKPNPVFWSQTNMLSLLYLCLYLSNPIPLSSFSPLDVAFLKGTAPH